MDEWMSRWTDEERGRDGGMNRWMARRTNGTTDRKICWKIKMDGWRQMEWQTGETDG